MDLGVVMRRSSKKATPVDSWPSSSSSSFYALLVCNLCPLFIRMGESDRVLLLERESYRGRRCGAFAFASHRINPNDPQFFFLFWQEMMTKRDSDEHLLDRGEKKKAKMGVMYLASIVMGTAAAAFLTAADYNIKNRPARPNLRNKVLFFFFVSYSATYVTDSRYDLRSMWW